MRQSGKALVPGAGNTGDECLFDAHPTTIGGFRFTGRDARAVGKPSIKEWQTALAFASGAYESSPYWIAALVVYGESKVAWREKLSQAMSVTGLALQTLHNLASIYRRVEEPERQIAQSVSHAEVVAPLPRPAQTKWLERSRTEGWSYRELRQRVQAAARSTVLEGQAPTMHVVDVTVAVTVEAQNSTLAEDAAWGQVRGMIREMRGAKLIAARALGR